MIPGIEGPVVRSVVVPFMAAVFTLLDGAVCAGSAGMALLEDGTAGAISPATRAASGTVAIICGDKYYDTYR
jgi:hypothetical protein